MNHKVPEKGGGEREREREREPGKNHPPPAMEFICGFVTAWSQRPIGSDLNLLH